MFSALVIPETKHHTEVLDAFEAAGGEITIESSQTILEGLEPALDIVPLPAAQHDVLEPEPPHRPSIPRATVGGNDRFALAVAKAALEEAQRVDGFAVLSHEQVDNFSILGIYGRKNEYPALLRPNFCLVDDEASPSLTPEELLL